MNRKRAAILVSCVLASQALAATYHVAQRSPHTSDANPGTEAQPLETIAAAMAKVKPGDCVFVQNGTYRESAAWDKQDWQQKCRMTLAAYPGQRPVIKGSKIAREPWTPAKVALRKPDGTFLTAEEYDPDAWRNAWGVDGAAPKASQAKQGNVPKPTDAPFVGICSCPWLDTAQMVFRDEVRLRQIGLQGSPLRAEKDQGHRLRKQWEGRGPEDVRRHVREIARILGEGGGYIFGTAHNILPDTPTENITALIDAYHEFGSYG